MGLLLLAEKIDLLRRPDSMILGAVSPSPQYTIKSFAPGGVNYLLELAMPI